MEGEIHRLEKDAYSAVLRAFKAQSDALTWEKEGLITELRKELRVSDDEHRELLASVNADDIIHEIREWRQRGGYQPARHSTSQTVPDVLPSHFASRKKQKLSQPFTPAGLTGSRSFTNRASSNALVPNTPAEGGDYDPIIGKKVWTRWPDDNSFYEATISDYDPSKDKYALVYDMHTDNETWEWVNFNEISRDDIRWEGDDTSIPRRGGYGALGRGVKKSSGRGTTDTPVMGRGRGLQKFQSRREILGQKNGTRKKDLEDIELLDTGTLVKEVDRVFALNQPDPLELERTKKMLKEHEQALVNAIARLAEAAYDDESGNEPCGPNDFLVLLCSFLSRTRVLEEDAGE